MVLLYCAVQPSNTDWVVLVVDDALGRLRVTRARIPDCNVTTYFNATLVASNIEGTASLSFTGFILGSVAIQKYPKTPVNVSLNEQAQRTGNAWFVDLFPPDVFQNANAKLNRDNVRDNTKACSVCLTNPILFDEIYPSSDAGAGAWHWSLGHGRYACSKIQRFHVGQF